MLRTGCTGAVRTVVVRVGTGDVVPVVVLVDARAIRGFIDSP